MENQINEAVVKVEQAQPQTSTDIAIFTEETESSIFASFDMSTPEGEKLALKCIAPPDVRLTDYLGMPFTIAELYAENVTFTADGGNRKGVRLILIDTEGTIYQTASTGIINSAVRILKIKRGNIRGTRVKVISSTTSKGFKTYSLVVAD